MPVTLASDSEDDDSDDVGISTPVAAGAAGGGAALVAADMAARLPMRQSVAAKPALPSPRRRASERQLITATATRGLSLQSVLTHPEVSEELAEVLGPHELCCTCGGPEVGGAEATKVLAKTFASLDGSVLALSGHYRSAERVVLTHAGRVVAVAVVQLHLDHKVLEVPILATERTSRRQGRGGLLVALLLGFARALALRTLVISATEESRAFWVKQGLHTAARCATAEKTALRLVRACGIVHGFANSALMACPVATKGAPSERHRLGEARKAVQQRRGPQRTLTAGLSWRRAAERFKYVDINEAGSFWRLADGSHQQVEYAAQERLPAEFEWVPYGRLEGALPPSLVSPGCRHALSTTARPVFAGLHRARLLAQLSTRRASVAGGCTAPSLSPRGRWSSRLSADAWGRRSTPPCRIRRMRWAFRRTCCATRPPWAMACATSTPTRTAASGDSSTTAKR